MNKFFVQLAHLPDEEGRKRFVARHRALLRAEVVEQLAEAVPQQVRVDIEGALRLAEAALCIAEKLNNREARARGLRAKGNVLYAMGQNRPAADLHAQALGLFEELRKTVEVGRTLSVSILPLGLLGEYDRAMAAAERARQIFTRQGDRRRLARVEINAGNILLRQDRFREALACYEDAYQTLLPFKDAEGLAVALHNIAMCSISLNDFRKALETYQQARTFCEEHGMPLLAAQADYNIAWLYYLRGEYSRAIEILRATRETCQKVGDAYHRALCDLDESEIYLELNLTPEAATMAQEAFNRFRELDLGYEAAKSLTNLAIAVSREGNAFRALELFAQARAIFVQGGNRVWPSLLDLYQALVLYNEGRFFEARRLCLAALEFFQSSHLPGKAVLCHLLLARLSLRTGELEAALECGFALQQLAEMEAPVLHYQAHCLMGEIRDAAGDPGGAYQSYQAARQVLETLRSSLRSEELKIAFMANKLQVYESLVHLSLSRQQGPASMEEAFGYMEQAKSRSLRDLMFELPQAIREADSGQSELVRRIRTLRQELNWYYHRIELEQLGGEERSLEHEEQLREQAREHENQLLRVLRELPSSEAHAAGLPAADSVSLDAIRGALAEEATLVEYFCVRDRILAAVLTKESLEVVPLTLASRVTNLLRMLQFQLAKFYLGAEIVQTFHKSFLEATRAHLKEIYEEVLAPVRAHLRGRHLVVVPHGVLHYVPFHALFDGEEYLIDSFGVSYAPSAAIYALCHSKQANAAGPSLILGVPDPRTPFILEEVQSVAAIVPEAELFLGLQASQDILKEKGPHSRLVHIATHGHFRQDNPMFSGVRMGDSYLSLYDLYAFRLPAELVTLSGCATGLNVLAAGDELLGLIRGLLHAGAQSLLLTMWDVHDRSTAEFMKLFYGRLREHGDKATALQGAMLELRQSYPHPYFWAPFVLVGKVMGA